MDDTAGLVRITPEQDVPDLRKSPTGMTTRVVGASLWSLGGQGVTLLASLIATPFTIRLLGSEAYGVFALVQLLIGYLSFADVGMGVASTRFAAEAFARGDEREEVGILWTALLTALVPIVIGAVALWAGSQSLASNILRLPLDLQHSAVVAFQLASVAFIARGLAGVMNTPLLVRLRLDINTLILAGSTAAQSLLIPVVLLIGGGLISATGIVAGVSVLTLLLYAVVARRFLRGAFKPELRLASLPFLLRFGAATLISSLAGMILISAEKLLLTRFVSVRALAYYTVAGSLVGLVAAVPGAISQPLLPAFSRMQADPDHTALRKLYHRALRGSLLWITPAVLILCVGAKTFFTIWAGPEFGRESTVPFYVLSIGLVFNAMTYIPCNLLMAFHKTNEVARWRVAEVVPYVLMAATLTYMFGIIGAALSWSLRLIIDSFLLFRAARQVSGFTFSPFVTKRSYFMLATITLCLPLVLGVALDASWVVILGLTVFSLSAYALIVGRLVLSGEERAWLSQMYRRRLTLMD